MMGLAGTIIGASAVGVTGIMKSVADDVFAGDLGKDWPNIR